MRRVLLTGFEPFGGASINPSWLAVSALDDQVIGDARVVARRLPVVFGDALVSLDAALEEVSPALVVAVGQAEGREAIALERVAINLDDAPIPDNAGRRPIDRPVRDGGAPAFFSTLPVKAMGRAIHEAGIPVTLSSSAGTFVCNHVFYGLMERAQARGIRAGFVHVPLIPEQLEAGSTSPTLALDAIVRALRIVVEVGLAPAGGAAPTTSAER